MYENNRQIQLQSILKYEKNVKFSISNYTSTTHIIIDKNLKKIVLYIYVFISRPNLLLT